MVRKLFKLSSSDVDDVGEKSTQLLKTVIAYKKNCNNTLLAKWMVHSTQCNGKSFTGIECFLQDPANGRPHGGHRDYEICKAARFERTS